MKPETNDKASINQEESKKQYVSYFDNLKSIPKTKNWNFKPNYDVNDFSNLKKSNSEDFVDVEEVNLWNFKKQIINSFDTPKIENKKLENNDFQQKDLAEIIDFENYHDSQNYKKKRMDLNDHKFHEMKDRLFNWTTSTFQIWYLLLGFIALILLGALILTAIYSAAYFAMAILGIFFLLALGILIAQYLNHRKVNSNFESLKNTKYVNFYKLEWINQSLVIKAISWLFLFVGLIMSFVLILLFLLLPDLFTLTNFLISIFVLWGLIALTISLAFYYQKQINNKISFIDENKHFQTKNEEIEIFKLIKLKQIITKIVLLVYWILIIPIIMYYSLSSFRRWTNMRILNRTLTYNE